MSSSGAAAAALTLAHTHGFPFFHAWAGMPAGWARAAPGEREAGITQLETALIAHDATGATLGRPYFLAG